METGRQSRSPIFKFKSSLKTSAIAFHAAVLEFTRRLTAQAEAARANYNGNVLCSKSLSSAGRMMPGKILCYVNIIQWVVVHQSEQNDHRRDQRACALYLCHAHPSVILCLRLLWTLCLLPCSG